MREVIKSDPKYSVSLERGSTGGPDDGRYHVVVDGQVIYSSRVEAAAAVQYEEVRDTRRGPSRERQLREHAAADVRAFRAGTWSDKQGRDAKKGGRGVGR